jgi:hypothetical protein
MPLIGYLLGYNHSRYKDRRIKKRRARKLRGASLQFELLEERTVLSITWANEFDPLNGFDNSYHTQAGVARQIVERAIADWNKVITNFNFPQDTDSDPNNNLNNVFRRENGTDEKMGRDSLFFCRRLSLWRKTSLRSFREFFAGIVGPR